MHKIHFHRSYIGGKTKQYSETALQVFEVQNKALQQVPKILLQYPFFVVFVIALFIPLCEKCPNTVIFLVRIFPYSNQKKLRIGHFSRSVLCFQATENIGMVMVFTIVSAAQEKLLEFVQDIKKELEKKRQEEIEEQRRLDEIKVSD